VKSPLILQPGPAALTDGLEAIVRILDEWAEAQREAGGRARLAAR
jgi:iron complex transport system substrate-binding protein